MAGTRDFENLRFWKNVRVPFFKFPQKNGVLKMPTPGPGPIFQIPAKKLGFENPTPQAWAGLGPGQAWAGLGPGLGWPGWPGLGRAGLERRGPERLDTSE